MNATSPRNACWTSLGSHSAKFANHKRSTLAGPFNQALGFQSPSLDQLDGMGFQMSPANLTSRFFQKHDQSTRGTSAPRRKAPSLNAASAFSFCSSAKSWAQRTLALWNPPKVAGVRVEISLGTPSQRTKIGLWNLARWPQAGPFVEAWQWVAKFSNQV